MIQKSKTIIDSNNGKPLVYLYDLNHCITREGL